MKTLQHPLFILSMLLFCLNQALEQAEVYIWPLYTHLDDLLCLPVTLTIILAAERAYFHNPFFILPKRYLLMAVLMFSIVFEGLLPTFAAKYTADAWDVVAYAVGAFVFQLGINRRILPQPINATK